eukprot:8141057-Pyramimonas_sp.AAC.1
MDRGARRARDCTNVPVQGACSSQIRSMSRTSRSTYFSKRCSAVITLLLVILINARTVSSTFVDLVLSTGLAKLNLADVANQTRCFQQLEELKSPASYELTPVGTLRPKQSTCDLLLTFSDGHCLCGLGFWANYTLNVATTLPPFYFYCNGVDESAVVLGDACYSGVHDCNTADQSICPLTANVPPATQEVRCV